MSKKGTKFLEAAKISCRAKIEEASARLTLYTSDPQAVADHSSIMDEILKAAADGAHAQDMLDFLVTRCQK